MDRDTEYNNGINDMVDDAMLDWYDTNLVLLDIETLIDNMLSGGYLFFRQN